MIITIDDFGLEWERADHIKHKADFDDLIKAYEELKEYQQLEADGRLVKLPCKVGDTVYIIAPNYCDCREECDDYDSEQYLVTWCKEYCPNGYKGIGVIEAQIEQIEIGNDIYFYTNKNARNDSGNIFLTKSEAEAKLKELEDI